MWQLRWWSALSRGDWVTRTESSVELSSTPTSFRVKESITAWEGEQQVFEKQWDQNLPRDLM